MNAERLHAIITELKKEYDSQNIDVRIQKLVESLEQVVGNSIYAQYQQELADALKALRVATSNSKSDGFSPTWRQILDEIGATPLLGSNLRQAVDDVLARNSITPAVALEELRAVHSRVKSFRDALDQGKKAFKHLGIGSEQLEPGTCEIGILIPRVAVDNQLVEFAAELKEVDFIINTFAEVATGHREAISIKTISSSDLLVFLKSNMPSAACLAVAVERIVALYKQILEVRKLHGDLLKQGVPADSVKGIEAHANDLMEKGIEKLSEEIVQKNYTKKDEPRKNELIAAVKVSLNKIANRIDRGFNIEVRVEKYAENAPESKDAEKSAAVQTILSASANMKFMKIEGPSILRLPESDKPKKIVFCSNFFICLQSAQGYRRASLLCGLWPLF